MRNIFKTFKENKRLSEENKILKAQNDSLTQFRKNFDNYYRDISGVKIVERRYDNTITLNGVFNFSEAQELYFPTDMCKEQIIKEISKQLISYIEFDVIDNAYGTKSMVGRLNILTRG